MNVRNHLILLFAAFSLAACQSGKPPKPAHFRALSMIQYPSATLSIQGKGPNNPVHQKIKLAYAAAGSYQKLPPGHYKMVLRVKGKPLLEGSYVLGEDGYYTLLAVGLLPDKWKVNPQTLMFHLKRIFAGEELESTNKNLPQWFMMRDNYDGSNNSAYIRIVNANPATPALTIQENDQSLKSGLGYPVESGMIKLKAGPHTLQAYYGKINVGERSFRAKPGYIYTAVLGSSGQRRGKAAFCILNNASRTLLNAK